MTEPWAPELPRWILLVDDDAGVREIFGEALRDTGWPVVTATDAASGQAAMLRQPYPSLLITDIDLGPGPSGLSLANHARSHFPALPIILISGHWAPEDEAETVNNAAFLRKPFRPTALLELVKQVLPEV